MNAAITIYVIRVHAGITVNISSRCTKGDNEHSSLPAAQLYTREGPKQSFRLRETLEQDLNIQLT